MDIKNQFNDSTLNNPVFNYGERKIPRHLTTPPFQSEVFLGRENDLQTIHDKLFNGNNLLLLVNGNGGIGKTTLASKYYEKYQDKYQYLAWVLSEKSIANALLMALEKPLALNFENTTPTAERLNMLLVTMASLNKPCLLVIDNANELEDLNENYQDLRRCSNFHLLLTTRITEFAKAAMYRIEGLPEDEALALFKEHYPQHQDSEDELVKQIREAVGGNTLVIELLAKNLNEVNQFEASYSVANLLDDLRSKGLLTLSESEAVTTAYQAKGKLRAEKPEAIIAAMYDLMALSDAEVALLSVFAVLPAENIPLETLKSLLPTTENLKATLKSLAQKGWIEYSQTEKAFKCSPVIQEITRKKNGNLRVDCQGLISILIEKLDHDTLHEDNYYYSSLFVRYAQSVVAAFVQTDYDCLLLCQGIGDYFSDTGNLTDALVFYNKMNASVFALSQADPDDADSKNGLAISYSKLGSTHAALGNLDQALQFFQECSRLGQELYESYPNNVRFKYNLAIWYSNLGETHADLGHLDQALQFYQDETELFEQLDDSYPNNVLFKNGLAISYSSLGETHAALGHLDQALQFYQDETELFEQLDDSYPNKVRFKNGLAISYSKLGSTHAALGNLDQALQFFQECSRLSQELYESYPNNVLFKNNLAGSYFKLGAYYQQHLNDNTQAILYVQQSETLWLELVRDAPKQIKFQRFLSIVQEVLAA